MLRGLRSESTLCTWRFNLDAHNFLPFKEQSLCEWHSVSSMSSEEFVEMEAEDLVPHVVILTLPCPGHLIPAAQMCRHLLSLGNKVSCFSTGQNDPSVERNLEEKFGEERIEFKSLVEDMEFVPPTVDLMGIIKWIQQLSDEAMAERLAETMRKLTPPPACIITDMFVGWSQDVADAFNIPRYVLYTMPANAMLFMIMRSTTFSSPPRAHNYAPGIWISYDDPTHISHDYATRNARRLLDAAMILVNTFEDFDAVSLNHMRSELIGKPNVNIKKILPIGPLLRRHDGELGGVDSTSPNQEGASCAEVFRWLDAQRDSSVLYVSFGTLFAVDQNQLHELAHGLEQSGCSFLWVYRPPNASQVMRIDASTQDSILDDLPTGFINRIKGRGKVLTEWAPQQLILAHKSVGGFMSHCGWNSILETIWAGKPIVAWPIAVDQHLTARYLVDDAKIAVEVHTNDSGLVESAEVAKTIMLLMDEETGSDIRTRFVKMQQLAHKALGEGGSSTTNLNALLNSLKPHLKILP